MWNNWPRDTVGFGLWHLENGAYQYSDISGTLHIGPYPCAMISSSHLLKLLKPEEDRKVCSSTKNWALEQTTDTTASPPGQSGTTSPYHQSWRKCPTSNSEDQICSWKWPKSGKYLYFILIHILYPRTCPTLWQPKTCSLGQVLALSKRLPKIVPCCSLSLLKHSKVTKWSTLWQSSKD